MPTYMFCFKEYKNFLYKCHFKGAFFFLKKLSLVPPCCPVGTSAPPVRFLHENPCNFFLPHLIYTHMNMYTPSGFLLLFLLESLFAQMRIHLIFLSYQSLVEIPTNLVLLIAVQYSQVQMYHLYTWLFICTILYSHFTYSS